MHHHRLHRCMALSSPTSANGRPAGYGAKLTTPPGRGMTKYPDYVLQKIQICFLTRSKFGVNVSPPPPRGGHLASCPVHQRSPVFSLGGAMQLATVWRVFVLCFVCAA